MQCPFNRNWIRFNEKLLVQSGQNAVDFPRLYGISSKRKPTHLRHGARSDVCSNRYDTFGSCQDGFASEIVFPAKHVE